MRDARGRDAGEMGERAASCVRCDPQRRDPKGAKVMVKTPLLAISYFLLGFVSCYLLRDRLWHDREDALYASLEMFENYNTSILADNARLSNEVVTLSAYIDTWRTQTGLEPFGSPQAILDYLTDDPD